MKPNSLICRLNDFVKSNEFTSINAINDLTEQLGYKISNGERRMRDLVKAGLVKKIVENGVVIGYKPVQLQKIEVNNQINLGLPTAPRLNPY
jgi:hypothetical protein